MVKGFHGMIECTNIFINKIFFSYPINFVVFGYIYNIYSKILLTGFIENYIFQHLIVCKC